ncbi:MAG: hypothetical protein Q8P13_02785 [bacterium]|nr:hypothetical protein [bacterium]
MPNYKITYGGWYQRTTLHLSEIYNFFAHAHTYTELPKEKLEKLRESLKLTHVSREVGYLEYVKATSGEGIEVRYYEDGLYILELTSTDILASKKLLEDYFENVFNPALSYLFSLGAPTPKVLANIKISHPTVVSFEDPKPASFTIDKEQFGEVYSKIDSPDVTVYKTHKFIFIVAKRAETASDLVEMQIFFREFKDQLEKYLHIHRKVWEEIADIKERKVVKGAEVEKIRGQLDRYQKTINLINNRINQMGIYVATRSSISKKLEVEEKLSTLFQYKFETLDDTHAYIKELWAMTKDYLASAIQILVELEGKSTGKQISSLTAITTIGVVASILSYMTNKTFPAITGFGVIYFLILLALTYLINAAIRFAYQQIRYKLTIPDTEKNI